MKDPSGGRRGHESADRLLWIGGSSFIAIALVSMGVLLYWPSSSTAPVVVDSAAVDPVAMGRHDADLPATAGQTQANVEALRQARLALEADVTRASVEAAAAHSPERRAESSGPDPVESASGGVSAAGNAPDPVAELFPKFRQALSAGRLFEPESDSAIWHVRAMRVLDPAHAMTLDAERLLFEALMGRYEVALDDLKTDEAFEILAMAEQLSVDSMRVRAARAEVMHILRAIASAEAIPASELELTHYVAPEYPAIALDRNIEGWVDVEFTVSRDGLTHDVAVTNASHEPFFTNEAVFAVSQWEFEPHRIAGHAIDQRAYTRIRFVIE
jgi:TonB family protein